MGRRVARLFGALRQALVRSAESRRERWARLVKSYGFRMPVHRAREAAQSLDEARRRIAFAVAAARERRARDLGALAARLTALSPLAVLERGYAVARREPTGALVRDAADLARGDLLALTFARGRARARVEETSEARADEGLGKADARGPIERP
jgi:exodeoxyribonuclease VII large subunit